MKRLSMRGRIVVGLAILPGLVFLAVVGACFPNYSTYRPATPQDDLLGRWLGHWVYRGTLGNTQITDDVKADWGVVHEQLWIHVIARDKDDGGLPVRESWLTLDKSKFANEYDCHGSQLRGDAGLGAEWQGHGQRDGDVLTFNLQNAAGGPALLVIAFNRKAGTWTWKFSNLEGNRWRTTATAAFTRN